MKTAEEEASERTHEVIRKMHALLSQLADEQPFAVRFTLVAAVRIEGGQDMTVETAGNGTSYLTSLMLARAMVQHAMLRKEAEPIE